MEDKEYEFIFNYLKFKFIPSHLPIGSSQRRNWAQSVKKKYQLIKEVKGTPLLEFVGIWYKRGLDALGQKRPVLLKVSQKTEWSCIMEKFHSQRGHPGRDGTMAVLTQHYYFPRMWKAVVKYLATCMCSGKKYNF